MCDTSFDFGFNIQTTTRKFDHVTVSQETLKHVAKLSNFNVDLQAKVMSNGGCNQYRAVCNKCKSSHMFDWEKLQDKNGHTWVDLSIFCTKHVHGPTQVESVSGRKFRKE